MTGKIKEARVEPDFSKIKAFTAMNASNGEVCPICGEVEGGAVVLIPIVGTQEDSITEAKQIHVACITNNIMYYPPRISPTPSPSGAIIGICEHPNEKEDENI